MAPSYLGAPSAWDPRRGSLAGVLRAGGPAVTQAGVLEGSPVQLYDGLARTKAKADLGAGGAAPLYPGFIPGGSDDVRWATIWKAPAGTPVSSLHTRVLACRRHDLEQASASSPPGA